MDPATRMILIVDDEPDVCWALDWLLSRSGFSVKKVLSGREALELVGLFPFEWVFVDAKLPDTEGFELAQLIRETNPAIRVVMISGFYYPDDEVVLDALEKGLITNFISKPFLNDDILKVIGAKRR